MKHLEDYLNELREEKASIMEVDMPFWREELNKAQHDFSKKRIKGYLDGLQEELLELDDKITEVHNSIEVKIRRSN